ncbi:TIGR02147 family protein [Fibrobacter sp. UWH5]|uniref:TIGR02147 family protein n=1 Tax=Fibrobacter sp. UWH5 TaxID=1896211 RepID=UPI000910AE66|nr:TIGR02147 family protein [Fibrobacter sp. UWH5]SHK97291.1 TIGR02147 family protein [Fibrobacter sp. UWH5]
MKPIVEYLDYRSYMREFYEERKRTSAFTWREFSRLSGFASSGYLKLVCDGKTRLRKAGAECVAKAMGLSGFQVEYFCCMVEFCDAQTNEEKQAAYGEMCRLADANKVRILGSEAYSYFSSWINPTLRELAPIMPGARPLEMARMLCPSVPAADVRYSLDQMVQMGLLKKIESAGEVSYVQTDVGINPADNADHKAAINVAVRSMQKQFARLAADALDEFDGSERNLSGITMGLDRTAYERVAKEMAEFRKKIESIVSEVKDYDRVYRINLQMFPLTRKLEEKDEK